MKKCAMFFIYSFIHCRNFYSASSKGYSQALPNQHDQIKPAQVMLYGFL